jgi:EAL domain-containing protein (putative c-di-GMP-specific phosphodiesterase class I)/GGDEF domain-containing protein
MANIDFEFVALWLLMFSVFFMNFDRSLKKKAKRRCYAIIVILCIQCSLCIITNMDSFTALFSGMPGVYPRLKEMLILLHADLVFVSIYLLFDYCRSELEPNMPRFRLLGYMTGLFIIFLSAGQISGLLYYRVGSSGSLDVSRGYIVADIYLAVYFVLMIVLLATRCRILGKKRSAVVGTVLVMCTFVIWMQQARPFVLLIDLFLSAVLFVFIIFIDYVDDARDSMTGALSEGGFIREASYFLQHTSAEYAVVAVSVHDFKNINNHYGRYVGDLTLCGIADRFISEFGGNTLCARLSADNFVILLPEMLVGRLPDGGIKLSEMLGDPRYSEYEFTLYYGIYDIKDKKAPVAGMIENARFAMELIRDNYITHRAYFTDELEKKISSEREMERMMYKGIKDKEFVTFFQPVYDLETGELASAEALVRWKSEKYGLISPGQFIPVFEKNGFISEVDQEVMRQVCGYLKKWKNEGRKQIPVSVNVSRQELKNAAFCIRVQALVNECGLSPGDIKLEITESAFAEDENLMVHLAEQLHNAGFKIMMDDFGSGYSCFNSLGTLPVDILKIDMRFMESIDRSERSRAVFESIIGMTKHMGIPVVVEGVETAQQVSFVKALLCEQVQGFYFARPLEVSEFEKLL